MSSAQITYSGQCALPDRLIGYLANIRKTNDEFFADPPKLIDFDHVIEGKILVSSFFAGPATESSHHPSTYEMVKSMGIRAHRARNGHALMIFEDLHLQGMEIHLYESANGLPSEYRMSFVFVRSDRYPLLNGQLVQVEGREECQLYKSKRIRSADWFLTCPRIWLRRHLESWTDEFFAWIKEFFIPDFRYWRYEDNPGFEEFRRKVSQACGEDPKLRNQTREAIFNELLTRYADELEQIRTWRAGWR